ncbi:MAG: HlyD family secretion protein, partial [Opitutales bacterium]
MSLKNLASDRHADAPKKPPPTDGRRLWDRLLAWLPLYLLAGFLGIGWILFGEQIAPGRPVEVTTVVTRKADSESRPHEGPASGEEAGPADPFSREVLFQASGWIEADPFPIRATTLRDGVIEEVFILEGDRIEEGQLLAKLNDEDARIDVAEARARLEEHEASLLREKAGVEDIRSQLATHALEVAALEAELEVLRDEERRLTTAGKDTFPESDIRQTQLRLTAGEARLAALEGRRAGLQARKEAAGESVGIARHRVAAAAAAVERTTLDLARTEIRSPVDGVVQQLFAAPGGKRMLGMDDPESATIASIYQP